MPIDDGDRYKWLDMSMKTVKNKKYIVNSWKPQTAMLMQKKKIGFPVQKTGIERQYQYQC